PSLASGIEPQRDSTEVAAAVEIRKAEPVAPEPNGESSSAENPEGSSSADANRSSYHSETKSSRSAATRQTSRNDAESDHSSSDQEQIASKPAHEGTDGGSSVGRTIEPETVVQPPPSEQTL